MASLVDLARSFSRVQRSEGKSPVTVNLYRYFNHRLIRWLVEQTGGDEAAGLTRQRLRDYYLMRGESCKASSVSAEYRAHRVFIRWMVAEDELTGPDPIALLRGPKVAVNPVPILSGDDISRLLDACKGNSLGASRDAAIVRLLLCGLRRGEIVGLRLADLNMDEGIVTVTGKGKTRTVAVAAKGSVALDRWLRARARTKAAGDSPSLFLDLSASGLYHALRKRAESVGVTDFYPHRVRHTVAHLWLSARGSESDLMMTMGWSSSAMLRRYGASAAAERAREAQRRMAIGDRF